MSNVKHYRHSGYGAIHNKHHYLSMQGSAKEDKKAKGKKKTEPEVNLVHSPPEYTVLAQFHVPLITIAEGEFGYSETVTCTEAPPTDKRAGSPDSDTESLTKKVHCDN